ncbi:MAG: hypothetical protein J3Q66DRAFT_371753 [Benniella sp.]|nr:MAG: hypothetical protein J3Q66DRAFT_371753 [Benniella sp.]
MWLPFFLALLSVIAYSWALKAQMAKKNIIQSDSARDICSMLLCAAWLASPSYSVNLRLDRPRSYCDNALCDLGFVIDIGGFLMALFVLLEMILAYLYERSFNVHRANPRPTTIVGGPSPAQQYPHNPAEPVQQFVCDPELLQQSGQQPPAYCPRPVMTAPNNQSPTIPELAPAYQP